MLIAPRVNMSLRRFQVVLGGVCALATLGFLGVRAQAQTQPASSATPTTVDTGRGPLTGSTRFIGLGGAFVAIAQDTDGIAVNPAATGLRLPYSWSEWDWGLGVDVAIGAWLPKNKYYNRPDNDNVQSSTTIFGSLAGVVYRNQFGVGVAAEAQRNAAIRNDAALGISTSLAANFGIVHAVAAYGFVDGQLLLGGGFRFVGMSWDRHNGGSAGLTPAGVGYEAGAIWKPTAKQYRIGAAFKSAADAKVPSASDQTSTIHVPWELAFGAAYQFGAKPLNPRFVTAKQMARDENGGVEPTVAQIKQAERGLYEAYQAVDTYYLLVSTELLVLESSSHGGFDQYWSEGERQPIEGVILSPRLGLESEVVPHILRVRAGSYYESPLVGGTTGRLHGTTGLDVRLFSWSVFGLLEPFDYWRLSLAVDGAREYLNTGISIGFWH
ncbi:MAG TPA: hypothetical protein VHB79_33070 [Polyangiaceae bacterium]|nr:hypothetical protein [Polyangiaceae bacterium]